MRMRRVPTPWLCHRRLAQDPQNANGGHFQLTLKPRLPAAIIDELWNNVILGMISDAIEPASMLTGARLVDKLDMKGTKALVDARGRGREHRADGRCAPVGRPRTSG